MGIGQPSGDLAGHRHAGAGEAGGDGGRWRGPVRLAGAGGDGGH